MELKNLRNKLNISQTDVANALGMSSQRYNKYELGVNEPDIDTLKKFADFFKTSIDEVIGYVSHLQSDDRYVAINGLLSTCTIDELDLILQFVKALKHKG